MTASEANTLAMFRLHFDCTFSKLGGLARSIWSQQQIAEMLGFDKPMGDSERGQALVIAMEDHYGLERCAADRMTIVECRCRSCNHHGYYMTFLSDAAKECSECGEMSVFLPPRKIKSDPS